MRTSHTRRVLVGIVAAAAGMGEYEVWSVRLIGVFVALEIFWAQPIGSG